MNNNTTDLINTLRLIYLDNARLIENLTNSNIEITNSIINILSNTSNAPNTHTNAHSVHTNNSNRHNNNHNYNNQYRSFRNISRRHDNNSYRNRNRSDNNNLFNESNNNNSNTNTILFGDHVNTTDRIIPISIARQANLSRNFRGGFTNVNATRLSNFFDPVPIFPTQLQIQRATRIVRYGDIENPLNSSCPISLDVFNEDDNITEIIFCNHLFNTTHLNTWFANNCRCPICRYDIRNYNYINNRNDSTTHDITDSENNSENNSENENDSENDNENDGENPTQHDNETGIHANTVTSMNVRNTDMSNNATINNIATIETIETIDNIDAITYNLLNTLTSRIMNNDEHSLSTYTDSSNNLNDILATFYITSFRGNP